MARLQKEESEDTPSSTPSSFCCGLIGNQPSFFRGPNNAFLKRLIFSGRANSTVEAENEKGVAMKNQIAPTLANNTGNNIEKETYRRSDSWTEEEMLHWSPNDYQKELVKLTWSHDFDFLYKLGSAIYTYIFEHNPQAKVLFPKIHQHGENWRESADFRSQSLKFVQTISYAVKNVYHMEECLMPLLVQIGHRHVQYAKRGFKPEYWNIFLDAMENALTDHIRSITDFTDQQRIDATQVWRQMAHYIIVHMKRGYAQGQGNA